MKRFDCFGFELNSA